jgi:hypothetical protein
MRWQIQPMAPNGSDSGFNSSSPARFFGQYPKQAVFEHPAVAHHFDLVREGDIRLAASPSTPHSAR